MIKIRFFKPMWLPFEVIVTSALPAKEGIIKITKDSLLISNLDAMISNLFSQTSIVKVKPLIEFNLRKNFGNFSKET